MATAALTATLAVAAHAAAGGPTPSGAGAAIVGVMAITLGALATAIPQAASWPGLLALLASGQVFGHVLLGSAGHQHSATTGHHSAVMTAAHVVAVIVGAALIAAAGRLGEALSRAVRAAIAPSACPSDRAPARGIRRRRPTASLRLQLAASVSHRGPPVRLAS